MSPGQVYWRCWFIDTVSGLVVTTLDLQVDLYNKLGESERRAPREPLGEHTLLLGQKFVWASFPSIRASSLRLQRDYVAGYMGIFHRASRLFV